MRFVYIILLFVVNDCLSQQAFLPIKIKTIEGQYSAVKADYLGNIYLLSSSNQLKKLNDQGDSIAVFNEVKRFGEAQIADVSNPVNILLYYKDFETIVELDGMLQLRNTIDLRKQNLFNVSAVALSYDGKVWLYDEVDNALKKIDDKGNPLSRTGDFRQLFDQAPTPTHIFDTNKFVYVYDPQIGIYVFDYYGAIKNKIIITGWRNVSIGEKAIYGTDDTYFYRYSFGTYNYDEWQLPEAFKKYKQLAINNKKIYALGVGGIDVYDISSHY